MSNINIFPNQSKTVYGVTKGNHILFIPLFKKYECLNLNFYTFISKLNYCNPRCCTNLYNPFGL